MEIPKDGIVVVVNMEGGVIHDVNSNCPVRIITLDKDIEGGDCANVHDIDGEMVYVIDRVTDVNAEYVEGIVAECNALNSPAHEVSDGNR